MIWNRRRFLEMTIGAAALPLAGCSHHASLKLCPVQPKDFETLMLCDFKVLRIGPEAGRRILLLHEITGLTADDLALARCLSQEGFNVFSPVIFGEAWKRDFLGGYRDSCGAKLFECEALKARSKVLEKLEPLADCLASDGKGPIGAIGMCLTGILPLAMFPNRVEAAVVCQPTLPFTPARFGPVDDQIEDLGLGDADLAEAAAASTPFLALHYAKDRACPRGRIAALECKFGTRVATIALPGRHRHSTLASDLDPHALADTITYLKVRLGVQGSGPMHIARLDGRACEITPDGWRATSGAGAGEGAGE